MTHSAPSRFVLQLRPDLGLADLLDHAELPVPRVVHDHVQPPEVVVRQLHRREVGVAVGDVQLNRQDCVPVLGHQVIEAGDVPGRRGNLIVAVQGRDRPLPAEAPRRTGNEPGLQSHQTPFRSVFALLTSFQPGDTAH